MGVAVIQASISHLASQLNQFMKRNYDLSEDIAVVSSLVEPDGSVAPHANNKLVFLLTNIEKDTTPQSGRMGLRGGDGRAFASSAPLYLNLDVMLAANFSGSNYNEALKFLSIAISFFQRQSVFDRQSTPDLDSRIEKLVLDIENLSIQDLSSLWGILGGKYMPSVLYRVRMVTFSPDDIIAQLPVVRSADTGTKN